MDSLLPIVVTLLVAPSVNSINPHPKLLLISMDGFRYDLLNSTLVPNIHKWASEGTWFVSGVKPQYITLTQTNHMAIATGLNAESHGIVSDMFYEQDAMWKTFDLYDYRNITGTPGIVDDSKKQSWYAGEPIWVTNEKADPTRHSACIQWPACDAEFPHANKPTFYTSWTKKQRYDEWLLDADRIVTLFTRNENPMNFIAWYLDEPETTLHGNGFYNGVYANTLSRLDEVFAHLIDQLEKHNLTDKINIILTSGHGNEQINGAKNIFCVRDYVDLNRVRYGYNMIYTQDDALANEVYNNLSKAVDDTLLKIRVFTKKGFPNEHFYKGMPSRIGDVILEPDIGYAVNFTCTKKQLNQLYNNGKIKLNRATSGYDPSNPEMWAILAISGPDTGKPLRRICIHSYHILLIHPDAFNDILMIQEKLVNARRHTIPLPFTERNHSLAVGRAAYIVDLYPLMCFLLNITAAPNNGTLNRIASTAELKHYKYKHYNGLAIVAIPFLGVIVLVMACVIGRLLVCPENTEETEELSSESL